MNLNVIGPAAAAAAFIGIWFGHVGVRKIEYIARDIRIPALSALAAGLALEALSLAVEDLAVSAALGILGVTLLWDALEFRRQQNRIRHGHAPANPANPRHVRILAEHPDATTFDWLDRSPRGRAYSADELRAMKNRSENWGGDLGAGGKAAGPQIAHPPEFQKGSRGKGP